MPVIVRFAVPVLETVTTFALLVVLTRWKPKSRLVGDKVTAGAGVPEPVKGIWCGLPLALSVMVS